MCACQDRTLICSNFYCRASFGGYIHIIKLLLDYKADGRPNADSGITPLYAACFAGHLEVVVLLSRIFPKHLVIPVNLDEMYPLHAAVMKNRVEVVYFLLGLRETDADRERKRSQQEAATFRPSPLKMRRATTSG